MFIFQIPTPTPVPHFPMEEGLELPSGYVYDSVMNMVQIWNSANSNGALDLFQAGIVLMLIFIGMGIFFRRTNE